MGFEALRARALMTTFDAGDEVTVTRNGEDSTATVTERVWSWHADTPLRLTNGDGESFVIETDDLVSGRVSVALKPVYVERQDRPMPGDAVRLASPWRWAGSLVKVGDFAVIGGVVGEYPENGHESITFKTHAFRDTVVSCSGGPGTIATDLSTLTPTADRVTLSVWRWRDGHPGKDNGKDYTVSVPVWEWRPQD